MNMIEKVDLTKAYYLQHLIAEHYQECMDEWYKKCKFKKDKEAIDSFGSIEDIGTD